MCQIICHVHYSRLKFAIIYKSQEYFTYNDGDNCKNNIYCMIEKFHQRIETKFNQFDLSSFLKFIRLDIKI